MLAEKIIDGKPTGWQVVVPDHIKTDAQAHKFMQDLLPNEEGTWRIARDRDYFMSLVNNIVESTAKRYGFDSAISARSYAGTENKYQAFSIGFTKWSAEFWNVGEAIASDVMSGKRAIPTDDELLGLLPRSSSYISEDMIKSTLPNMGTSEDIDNKTTDTSSIVQEPEYSTPDDETYDEVPVRDEATIVEVTG